MFIGRTDVEAETPILWPLDGKSWLTGKDPDAGKDWRQEEKGTTEDEMVGWHHWRDGHEFEQALGVGGRQGGLVCCSPWGLTELDTTEWLNWTSSEAITLASFVHDPFQQFKWLFLILTEYSLLNSKKVLNLENSHFGRDHSHSQTTSLFSITFNPFLTAVSGGQLPLKNKHSPVGCIISYKLLPGIFY